MFGVAGLRGQSLIASSNEGGWVLRAKLRYGAWAFLWILGHVLGGSLVGATLGWSGAMLSPQGRTLGVMVLSICCLAWGLHQLGVFRLPMPQLSRQVARSWLLKLPWNLVALGYGVQLGCGLATRITVATTYAVVGCTIVAGSAAEGAALMGLYGAARGFFPVLVGAKLTSPQRALGFAVGFDVYERSVGKLNGLILVTSAVIFAVISWHGLQ
jgi:hypothetical protein